MYHSINVLTQSMEAGRHSYYWLELLESQPSVKSPSLLTRGI